MRPDLRTRLVVEVAKLVGTDIADLTDHDLARARRPLPRSVLTEWVIGRRAPGTVIEDVWLPAAGGDVRARVYRPSDASRSVPVVVHFHGGGFVLGHHLADWLGSQVAARVGALVVSVDYRLAPEHPYPAGRDDCYAVTAWLAEHAETLGGRGDRLAVMGDSAGGTLAAVVALMARDRGGPLLRAQVLAYPATDAHFTRVTPDRVDGVPVLTHRDLEAYRRHYLGPSGNPSDPYVSPLRAGDLRGLPRALVVTAEYDPLDDSGQRYAHELARAGVAVRATRYVGAVHGFLDWPGLYRYPAHQALAEITTELAGALA